MLQMLQPVSAQFKTWCTLQEPQGFDAWRVLKDPLLESSNCTLNGVFGEVICGFKAEAPHVVQLSHVQKSLFQAGKQRQA